MAKTATASWSIVTRDEQGAIIDISFECPHCHYNTGDIIFVGESGVGKLDGSWETDQVCKICDKEVTVQCF